MRLDRTWLAIAILFFFAGLMFPARPVLSHCEIPCGIFGDKMRIEMMHEDIATIEKSMKQIEELSKEEKKNYNQIVRWVVNKEHHADKIRDVVTQYFMAQRIKPVPAKDSKGHGEYLNQLTLLHQMIVTAMKCKQTTDLANVEELRRLLEAFAKAYHAH